MSACRSKPGNAYLEAVLPLVVNRVGLSQHSFSPLACILKRVCFCFVISHWKANAGLVFKSNASRQCWGNCVVGLSRWQREQVCISLDISFDPIAASETIFPSFLPKHRGVRISISPNPKTAASGTGQKTLGDQQFPHSECIRDAEK